jgi:hypothetical protein
MIRIPSVRERPDLKHVKTLSQPTTDTESETEAQFQRYYKIVNERTEFVSL